MLAKRKKEFLTSCGKVKRGDFDFARITLWFNHADKQEARQIISDSTCADLDFDELFMYDDRTISSIGQQYLYHKLRCISKSSSDPIDLEKAISYFRDNPSKKEFTLLQLHKLSEPGGYFLHRLAYTDHIQRPKWFAIIPVLSVASVFSAIMSIFNPGWLIAFILIFVPNIFIHYWNKNNLMTYSNSIPQLILLHQVAKQLLVGGVISNKDGSILESTRAVRDATRLAFFYQTRSAIKTELGLLVEYVFELLKAAVLLEPILIFRVIHKLGHVRKEIKHLVQEVATLDVAIAIGFFRENLPVYCNPTFTDAAEGFNASALYHPLIVHPVSNDIVCSDGKSVLISGSNMSGKTTFIRTVGINVILAQTINTVCARAARMPPFNIYSAIRISDDLQEETSYFFEEVKRMKTLIESNQKDQACLFLLDELFKGTNTIERIAAGKAVLSYLNRDHNLVLASSHDIELTELLHSEYDNYHFSETIEGGALQFDYLLKKGKSKTSNAIRLLEINDYSREIIEEANQLAEQLRMNRGNTLRS